MAPSVGTDVHVLTSIVPAQVAFLVNKELVDFHRVGCLVGCSLLNKQIGWSLC